MAEPGAATDYVADPTAGAVGEGQPIPAAGQAVAAASAPKLLKSHEGSSHGDGFVAVLVGKGWVLTMLKIACRRAPFRFWRHRSPNHSWCQGLCLLCRHQFL